MTVVVEPGVVVTGAEQLVELVVEMIVVEVDPFVVVVDPLVPLQDETGVVV